MTVAGAFDDIAAGYDSTFTDTLLGRLLRRRVWQVLARCFHPGEHILELASGTGTDAVWLGKRGVAVHATDGAEAMVRIARTKARRAGLEGIVDVRRLSLQEIAAGKLNAAPFDGVFSNFGGLNTIQEWPGLARALASLVRPDGWAVLVVMGPVCPWETGWHLLRGQPQAALRRWRSPVEATVGRTTIPVWYPSPGRLRRDFSPWFRARQTLSLGLWLPPSYLGHLVVRAPRLFALLDRIERQTASLTAGLGDHYILLLQRTSRHDDDHSL